MRNFIGVIVVLALLAAGGTFLFLNNDTAGSGQVAEPTTLPPVTTDSRVIAEAKVVPLEHVELNFTGSGEVAELMVAEGETVTAGAALARLDTRDLELRVAQARANLAQARANYEQIREGATEEEIAAAEARLRQARANLNQTEGNVTGADIEAAQAQLEQARARLARLEAGPKDNEITRLQAELDQARTHLQNQRDALSHAKTSAEREIEQAANRLRDTQAEYSRIYWENRELEDDLRGFGRELPQDAKDREAAALRAVQDAERAVSQAQANYEQAQQNEISGIAAAEARVTAAQASLDLLLEGADSDDLAAARAQVAQAQAHLSKLLGQQRAGSLDAAGAAVDNAEAELSAMQAPATEATLDAAAARVEMAEVDLRSARLALEKATLLAPMDGSVAELNLKVGEVPSPAEPALVLADFSEWRLETDDLTELSVVRIREGDPVSIRFDAIDDFELAGTVTQIKPIGENRQGDIVYTVVVAPDAWDERLRWNMTASVYIGD
jgi:HlyD family secretion protein